MDTLKADGINDNSLLTSLIKTTSNISCEFDPKYERSYRDLFDFIVQRQINLNFFAEYFMKIVVNLRYRRRFLTGSELPYKI